MPSIKRALATCLLSLAVLVGAVTIGCNGGKRLEVGGPYAPAVTNADGSITATPNYPFFAVEASFVLAYSVTDAAFKFEQDNRAMLWKLSPDIKRELDKIRIQASAAKNKYILAREAYKAVPTPDGLSSMQTALVEVQKISAAASAIVKK